MDTRPAADRLEELYPTPTDCAEIGAALAKVPKEERDGLFEMLKDEQLKLALDKLLLAPAPETPTSSPLSSQMTQQLDIIDQIQPYLFREIERATAATALSPKLLATYRHGDHKRLQENSVLEYHGMVGPYDDKVVVEATVRIIDDEEDYILMSADMHLLCAPTFAPEVRMTYPYVSLGFAGRSGPDPTSVTYGHIACRDAHFQRGHLFGDGGSRPGDSGGPVFTAWDGKLFGMCVGAVPADGAHLCAGPSGIVPGGNSPRVTIVDASRMMLVASKAGLL